VVYGRGLSVSFERADIEILAEKLKRIFEDRRRYLQVTLDGTVVTKPVPILTLFGRVVRGLPVDASRLRVLEPVPHAKLTLAVDASAKVLFNLGATAIIESKVVAVAYRGVKRIGERKVKRAALVSTKFEAAEWLTRIEYETALKALAELAGSGYLLLDRSLTAAPLYRPSTRELIAKVERRALASGLVPVGIPKRTKLALDTGEGALGYISRIASKRLGGYAFYYYPLFREESLPPWMLGSPAVAKLSELSKSVLRIDVSRRALARLDCGDALGDIAFLQDPSNPGYPYPLKAAHEESRIGESELEVDRMALTELLREWGVGDQLLAQSAAYTSFKEKSLWGDVP
jgi:hypothetical protein